MADVYELMVPQNENLSMVTSITHQYDMPGDAWHIATYSDMLVCDLSTSMTSASHMATYSDILAFDLSTSSTDMLACDLSTSMTHHPDLLRPIVIC